MMELLCDFFTERRLAHELRLSVWALRAWRRRGYGPRFVKVGRAVLYPSNDVRQFLAGQPAGPVS